jgi:hypothetical protein
MNNKIKKINQFYIAKEHLTQLKRLRKNVGTKSKFDRLMNNPLSDAYDFHMNVIKTMSLVFLALRKRVCVNVKSENPGLKSGRRGNCVWADCGLPLLPCHLLLFCIWEMLHL